MCTIAVYVRAGKDIWNKRQSLRNFSTTPPDPLPVVSDPFQPTKTTEVTITSEAADVSPSDSIDLEALGGQPQGIPKAPQPVKSAYSVSISSNQLPGSQPPQPKLRVDTHSTYSEKPREIFISPVSPAVPISATLPNLERVRLNPLSRRNAANQADTAIWSYTKVAVLFFVAMMVTWVPSSANRVYSVVHPGQINLGLEYASAFVLPLQGFWNAIIYTTTSLPACEAYWEEFKEFRKNKRLGSNGRSVFGGGADGRRARRNKNYTETDSVTELQESSRSNTRSGR
jgi:hypothetical protein